MIKNEVALSHSEYIEKNLDLIQNQSNLKDSDLKNFLIQCKRTGLDPITKQIYAIPAAGGKLNIMASIDGLRLIAERSGAYEGQTPPMWCGPDGKWVDVWLEKVPPKACKMGVHKKNFKEALVAIALFDEYAGRDKSGSLTFMWNKMPALMIAKVAESLALRKAFPNEMSGIFAPEEFDQSENPQKNAVNIPQEKEVKKVLTTEQVSKVLDVSHDIMNYRINAGPKNNMTGTLLTDHAPQFLYQQMIQSQKWHNDNKRDPHSNTKELWNHIETYLRHVNFEG